MLTEDDLSALFDEALNTPAPDEALPGAGHSPLSFVVLDGEPNAGDQSLAHLANASGSTDVRVAGSVDDALLLIKGSAPDVVLCDYAIPGGKSGQTFLETLRRNQLLPETSVFVMVTSERNYAKVMAAVEHLPDDYILRPFQSFDVIGRIQRLTQRKQRLDPFYQLRRKGDIAGAVAVLDQMLAAMPPRQRGTRQRLARLRAETLFEGKRFDEAGEAFINALASDHPPPWAFVGYARVLAAQGDLKGACENVRAALNADGDYLVAYELLARWSNDLLDHTAAQAALTDATQRSPLNVERRHLLAEVALANGDMRAAARAISGILENSEALSSDARIGYARVLLDDEQGMAAYKVLSPLRKEERSSLSEAQRFSLDLLLLLARPNTALPELVDGVRRSLHLTRGGLRLGPDEGIDGIRYYLTHKDPDAAFAVAERILRNHSNRSRFSQLRNLFKLYGHDKRFNDLKRVIAESTMVLARPMPLGVESVLKR